MQINGQAALVAGGASGLGKATVGRLAEMGAEVTILDFDAVRAEAAAAEIGGFAQACDVADEQSVAAAVAASVARFGAPRIVVNCAGIADAARVVKRDGAVSGDVFRRVIGVNLIGTFNVMSHCAQAMLELPVLDGGERGVIINTASVAYEDGQIGQTAYAASKGGVAAMCLPAAREFARSAVRVLAIAPGLFQTPMMEGLPDEVSDQIRANIPFPDRLGAPDEFARLVTDSIENPYLNGTVIRLDGAVRLPPR